MKGRTPNRRPHSNSAVPILGAALVALVGASPGLVAQEAAQGHRNRLHSTEAGSRVLDLEETLDLALERSRQIRVARAGLAEAGERVGEAWSNVYPSVDFSASYTRNVSPQVSFLPSRIFNPDAPEGEFTPIQFGADNSWQSNITVEQPLFEAQAFIGVGSAGRFRELQEEVLRGTIQETVTRVRTGYFDLLLAQEQARLTENSLERVRRSLEETRAMNEAGLASDYDVLRLEVETANLEPNLRRARNSVTRARRALALELDLEDPSSLRVEGALAELDLQNPDANSDANRKLLALTGLVLDETPDTAALVTEAQSRRTDVRQAEATVDLRQAELRVEQVEYLPRISLFGNYNIQAQQNGAPDFFGGGRTRAYSRNVGVQVSVPIFTGFRRDAAADRRRAVLRQARTQARLARDRARTQVLDLLDQVEEARLRARGQELAVEQARRGYEIAAAEYREGLGGQLQLTDAEVALRQSEFNYAEAVYDYLTARARLDQAVGDVPLVDRLDR